MVEVLQAQPSPAATTFQNYDLTGNIALTRNASLMKIDMVSLLSDRPDIVHRMVVSVAQLLQQGKAQPLKSSIVYPFSQASVAFEKVQTEKSNRAGSVVLVPGVDDVVMVSNHRD